MLANVFRIGGLQQVSWFQLLPEGELLSSSSPSLTRKERTWQDLAALQVMRAHMSLQEEDHFSTWTLSEDKVKLWLFLPGRHESFNSATTHTAINGLKVVGQGLWRAPGDCNDVSNALSQALKNRCERAFQSLSYVRFGNVFVKCRRQGASDPSLRKPLPSCELVFTASEEAIFVHVLVRRKRVRQLSITDLQVALAQQRSNVSLTDNSLAVVVAPHGVSGRLSGCCLNDLVTQLHQSKQQTFSASSLPFRVVASSSANGSTTSGQACYAEVWLGQSSPGGSLGLARQSPTGDSWGNQTRRSYNQREVGQALIYPLDAVLVLMRPPVPSHTYLQRALLQDWAGTKWLEDGLEGEESAPAKYGTQDGDGKKSSVTGGVGANGLGPAQSGGGGITSSSSGSGGSSNSSSSSQGSSGSSSSSEADAAGTAELEADAESLGSKPAGMPLSMHNMHALGPTSDSAIADVKASQGVKRGRSKPIGGETGGDSTAKAVKRSNSIGADMSALLDATINEKKAGGGGFPGETSAFAAGLSSNMVLGTPRGVISNQLPNPWDQWNDDEHGLGVGFGMGMDIQSDADILAEFGDFGDFFEDDGLGFGEPPGTAESQVPNFLFDCGEVTNTPGTGSMDTSDPMLLPILDFPMLEGFGHQAQPPQNEPLSARGTKANMFKDNNNPQASGVVGARLSPVPPPPPLPVALETRPKAEAMLLFAPGFEPVDLSGVQEVSVSSMISRAPYIPVSKTASVESPPKLEAYVYSAMPPETVKLETLDTAKPDDKGDKEPTDNGDSKKKADPSREYHIVSGTLGNKQVSPTGQPSAMEGANADLAAGKTQQAPGKKDSPNVIGGGNGSQLESNKNGDRSSSVQSPVATLATELECALLQVAMCRSQDTSSSVSSSVTAKATPMLAKESSSDITQVQSDALQSGRSLSRPQQQERRKKVPERIAGHGADEDMHEGGSRAAQVGVWRPVGAPKPPSSQQSNATTTATTTHNSMAADSRLGLLSNSNCAAETAAGVDEGCAVTGAAARQSQWQEVLNALPLLAQQASITVDAALDGDYGDGPLSWLASQELRKQQRTCGNHVGCGGMLSVAHCLDQSGVELMNPLTAEVSAATVASLLQSDVRIALSNAFGETSMDGPLALVDWCRGRVQMSDGGHFSESTVTDSKEVSSTITVVGEPITPPQLGGGLKAAADMEVDVRRSSSSSSSRVLENSSLSEQTENCQKRGGLGDDLGMLESDVLTSHGPTILALPIPALLVGYQDDWLKTSSSTLHLWEKAPLEPYAPPKQVNYLVVCLASEPLVMAAANFFQQLSSVYEACRLGSHMPAAAGTGQSGLLPGASLTGTQTPPPPGFMLVDVPGITTTMPSFQDGSSSASSSINLATDFVASMNRSWNLSQYRKALCKVCKALPISAGSATTQRDPEPGPCTVVYVICPVLEPHGLLQTMVDVCQSLGSAVAVSDKDSQAGTAAAAVAGEDFVSSILGFSVPRFALQLVTAGTIFKANGPHASGLDVLKQIALGVYNKLRRIPRRAPVTEFSQHSTVAAAALGTRARAAAGSGPSLLQSNTPMPGLWKDCSSGRSSGNSLSRTDAGGNLESSTTTTTPRNTWESGWKSSSARLTENDTGTLGADVTHDAVRYLYEPAFILAEAGTPDMGVGLAPARTAGRDATRVQGDEASASTHGGASGVAGGGGGGGGGGADMGSNTTPGGEALDGDSSGSRGQQAPALHCCYAWTEDGHWMVSVWTDARGELLDTHVLPLAYVDTQREGVGGLYGLFSQVLQQGLQLLTMAVDAGSRKPRGITITRLGGFFEKECQEWNRVIMSIGGDEVCKWPLQIRHSQQDSSTGGLGGMACSSEVGMLSDSALGLAGSGPASPNPSSSFGVRGKTTTANYGKGSGSDLRRQGGQVINQVVAPPEPPKGAFQWVQSISLVSLCVDQSLQIVTTPDGLSISGAPPGGVSPLSWPVGTSSSGAQSIGITTVRTLASVGAAYLVVPAHESRLLAPGAVLQQLPPGGSSASHEHPPSLAHCLHSSGPACPVASAFVVLGATQAAMTEYLQRGIKEDWPSTIHIGLIAHYGGGSPRVGGMGPQQDVAGPPSSARLDMVSGNSKPLKSPMGDCSKSDQSLEVHKTLQVVASEMHALSWLTTALTHVHHHHSPLPFHCEVVQRFQRLLGFLDTELGPPMSSKSLLQV